MSDSPSILLATPDPAVSSSWDEVLAKVATTARVDPTDTAALDGGDHVVVLDLDALSEGERQRAVIAAAARIRSGGPQPVLVTAAPGGYAELFAELRAHGLRHVIAAGSGFSAIDLAATVTQLLRPTDGRPPGPGVYFDGAPEIELRRVRSSREVPALSSTAQTWAADGGLHPRLARGLATVVDELVMNALFQGPTGRDGRPRFADLPRRENVTVEPGEEVEVRLARTSGRVGIAVRDTSGRLHCDRVVDRLEAGFRGGVDQVENKVGGAGLGLYYSFQAVSHLAVHVASGRHTEIIALIDGQPSYRAFANRPKSFNCFADV